jgi:hypothetical protein
VVLISGIYFITYLQEEAYGSDTSKMQVAPGCVGTRQGLRGQANRCHIDEFVDYIWKERVPGETKPTNVIWPANARNLQSLDAEKITRMVNQQLKVPDPAGGNPKPLKGSGYTGGQDVKKLVPNPGTDTYFSSLEKMGKFMKDAREFFEANSGSWPDTEKDAFKKWNGEGKKITEIAVDLRTKDKWDALNDKKKGNLAVKLGINLETIETKSKYGVVSGEPICVCARNIFAYFSRLGRSGLEIN